MPFQLGENIFERISPTDDPAFQALFDRIMASIPGVTPPQNTVRDFIGQGVSSPLLAAILEPALQRLLPAERAGRQALTDTFRRGGGLAGSPFAAAAGNLESEFVGRRGELVSDLTMKALGPILQSLLQEQTTGLRAQELGFEPAKLMSAILQLLRPETLSGRIPPPIQFGPAGGGGGGGGFSSAAENQARALIAARESGAPFGLENRSTGNIQRSGTGGISVPIKPESYLEWVQRVFGYDPLAPQNPAGDFGIGGSQGGRVRLDRSGGAPTIVNDPFFSPSPSISFGPLQDAGLFQNFDEFDLLGF